jgi:hypothetical protein
MENIVTHRFFHYIYIGKPSGWTIKCYNELITYAFMMGDSSV